MRVHLSPSTSVVITTAVVKEFLTAKARLSPHTLATYRRHLALLAKHHPHLPTTPAPLEQTLASVNGQRTAWNYYVTWRTFYRWLVRRGILPARDNPVPRMEPPPSPKPTPYYLDQDELRLLLNYPGHSLRDRALLALLADTGMRIGEAWSITPDTFHGRYVIVKGKTGPRPVAIHPITRRLIGKLLRQGRHIPRNQTIWYGKRGPMTVSGLKQAVRKAFRRAGFHGRRMSAHRLRHTFASLWDGETIDGMLQGGWRDTRSWMRYRHALTNRLLQEHRRHSPGAKVMV